MKHQAQVWNASTGMAELALAGLLVAMTGFSPAAAAGKGAGAGAGSGSTPPGGGPNTGFTDEGIGSLPAIHEDGGSATAAESKAAAGVELYDFDEPYFFLHGSFQQLAPLIVGAWGTGFVGYTSIDSSGNLNLRFHGDVRVVLNDQLLLQSKVQLGMGLGTSPLPGLYTVGWSKVESSPQSFSSSLLIPIEELVRMGVLEKGALKVNIMSSAHEVARLTIEDSGQRLLLTQSIQR